MRAFVPAVVAVVACRPAPPTTAFTLRIAVSGPLEAVQPDPELRGWTSLAIPIVYEPLLALGAHGELLPSLASRAEIAGRHAVRVWPRAGARFSDGSAVTLNDITTSVSRYGLKATGEGEAILLTSEDETIPTELLVSRAYIHRRAGEQSLGSGAFKVDQGDETHLLLSRVRPAPGFISRVRIDSYPTVQEAYARTLKGDADMLPEVESSWMEFFEGVPRLRVLRAPGPSAGMIVFNRRRLPSGERAELKEVLSSDEIRRLAFGEECPPPPQQPRRALAPDPLGKGRPYEVIALPTFQRFALAVRRALGARGGPVRMAQAPEMFTLIEKGEFDLAAVRPRVSPPAVAILNWRTGAPSNVFGYSNPRVDAALDLRDWGAAQRALEEDPPGVIVCTPPATVVLDARIRNVSLGSSFMESLPRWEVAQ